MHGVWSVGRLVIGSWYVFPKSIARQIFRFNITSLLPLSHFLSERCYIVADTYHKGLLYPAMVDSRGEKKTLYIFGACSFITVPII